MTTAAPPPTPPGWYPSPSDPSVDQWWDGAQWTPSTKAARKPLWEQAPAVTTAPAPAGSAVAVPPAPQLPDMTLFAWGLVFLPLVAVPFFWVLNPLWMLVPAAIVCVVGWWLAREDGKYLAAAGRERVQSPRWIAAAILLPAIVAIAPLIYLVRRTLRNRSTALLPVANAGVLAAMVFVLLTVSRPDWALSGGNSFTFGDEETGYIAQKLADQVGEPVHVDCDAGRVTKGDTFPCMVTVTRTGQSGRIRVTIGSGGTYSWVVTR